ncbi:MAG TPA: hypothetical protein VFD84_08365 [Candidatus Binatia bacterium]|nr:hypothetical protein [Candidatus Binatia bacterium]
MAARRRPPRPAPPRAVLLPPREHCWVESDAYDRAAFAALVADAPSLAALLETGRRIVPHWDALLEDVFCLLFKLEPRLRAPDAVAPAAALNRVLLETFRDHPILDGLREETQLDETQAGLGTVLVGEQVLALLKAERLLPRGDLLDLWDLARQEDELRSRGEETADLDRAAEEGGAAADAVRKARAAVANAAQVAEARLRQKAQNVARRLGEMPARARAALPAAAAGVAREVAEAKAESRQWGTGLGAGGRTSAGRQIELGRRLATNPKLKQLSRLLGRMREQMTALRKRRFERTSEEVFDVRMGRDVDRLLPPELIALRHPLLRRDFTRRLVEGRLLSYALRGPDERGRGPMIVCLDGSSSMAGDKEIWSKAVALTLLEIARRQRRLFRFVCFSSADTPLFVRDLNPGERWEVHEDRALDVAEYFPGGGTDFETPLSAAVDCLGTARYRRGDVVLVTDGECDVRPEWRADFLARKERLAFSLYAVLIDVGPSSSATLARLADRVTAVSTLTDAGTPDLFLRL